MSSARSPLNILSGLAVTLFLFCSLAFGEDGAKPFDVEHPPFATDDYSWMNGSNRQPASLLAYYLAQTMPSQTKNLWPLETNDLAQVFSDQGKKFDH